MKKGVRCTLIWALLLIGAFNAAAEKGVSFEVRSALRAPALLGAGIDGNQIQDGASPGAEHFRITVVGRQLRADLLSQVGVLPAGTVILAREGDEAIAILDPKTATFYETTIYALNVRQTPAVAQSLTELQATVLSNQIDEKLGGERRNVELRYGVNVSKQMTLCYSFRLEITSRPAPDLEPAKRLLYALLRQDFSVAPRFSTKAVETLPNDFPVEEYVTPGITLWHRPHPVSEAHPQWLHRRLRFAVEGITATEVDGSRLSVPSSYKRTDSPL